MFIDPKKVVFESKGDVVDYVSRGILPPTKKQFDQVMRKVRQPDAVTDENIAKRGKEVVIFDNVMTDEERKSVDEILTKLYGNRVRNRNIRIGIAAVGVVILAIACGSSKDKNDPDDKYEYIEVD